MYIKVLGVLRVFLLREKRHDMLKFIVYWPIPY